MFRFQCRQPSFDVLHGDRRRIRSMSRGSRIVFVLRGADTVAVIGGCFGAYFGRAGCLVMIEPSFGLWWRQLFKLLDS